jgi:hypothetical protein
MRTAPPRAAGRSTARRRRGPDRGRSPLRRAVAHHRHRIGSPGRSGQRRSIESLSAKRLSVEPSAQPAIRRRARGTAESSVGVAGRPSPRECRRRGRRRCGRPDTGPGTAQFRNRAGAAATVTSVAGRPRTISRSIANRASQPSGWPGAGGLGAACGRGGQGESTGRCRRVYHTELAPPPLARGLVQWRWAVIAIWVVVAVVAFVRAPRTVGHSTSGWRYPPDRSPGCHGLLRTRFENLQ